MKKKIICLFFLIILCTIFLIPAFAVNNDISRLNDNADLLTDEEKQELNAKLDEASERLKFDIAVVTADDLGGKDYMAFADDFYDYNGYGFGDEFDGALLLISMEPDNHMCWISTSGFGITAITDAGIDYFLDDIVDNGLADGDFYYAVDTFIDLCGSFVTQARIGKPYDVGYMPYDQLDTADVIILLIMAFAVAAAIGAAIGGIYTLILKCKMKSVQMQQTANNYVRQNSLNITNSSEIFLYKNVIKEKRESSSSATSGGGGSSTHTSSSGRTHGGGGRSF